jgi:hypothetical protein
MAAYCEYQNAILDQEGQPASRKRPRSLIIKKNKLKRRTIYCEERGNKMAAQTIPPPQPPVATLGPGPKSFQKNLQICGKSGRFDKKVADLRQTRRLQFGGDHGGFSLDPPIS